jgi:hypothetical protein
MSSLTAKHGGRPVEWEDAERRCATRRELAGQAAAGALATEVGLIVSFRPIHRHDVAQADRWTFGTFVPGWSWERELTRARRRPRRIEAAVYTRGADGSGQLAGLVLGRISNGHVVASIHFLGRAPGPNPLQGQFARVATRYLEFCAAAFACSTAALQSPIPELVEYYKALGFTRVITKKGKIARLEQDLSTDLAAAFQEVRL